MKNKSLTILFLIVVFSCHHKQKKTKEQSQDIFSVLSAEKTGITFFNELKEDVYMNGLFYEYYYNGGGVAVADFNNDDLIDIYFVSCLKSNRLYINKGNMEFVDVTNISKSGGGYGFGTGVTILDINNDGLMDIYYCKSGKINDPNKRRNELLVNIGMNSENIPEFENQAKKYGLDFEGFSTQASFFDYDRDGDLDMFLINHGIEMYNDNDVGILKNKKSRLRGEILYQNNNGKFSDVTHKAGIINNMLGFGLGLTVGDVNNDNWPDIYVGNDFSEKDHMYINNQDGTFREVSLDVFGHIPNFSMGNDIADINNDGLLDIMAVDMMAEDNYTQKTSMGGMNTSKFYKHVDNDLHYQYMYNTLQLNNGVNYFTRNPNFSNVAHFSSISSTDWSWAPLLFDMNNDGKKDIFVSNGIKKDFRNNDFINYRKQKQAEVIQRKTINTKNYITDLLHKMPKREKQNFFFLNKGKLEFDKMGITQPITCSNGAAYADFDNDGDLDIVVNNSTSLSFIYQNNSTINNYVRVKLESPSNNVNVIGARVELFTGTNRQISENYYTRGFQSAMADDIHFGLGSNTLIDSIRVIWSNDKYQVLKNLEANKSISIIYDESKSKEFDNGFTTKPWFVDVTTQSGINFIHTENEYDDFIKESLIPYRASRLGPALAVADVTGDGLDDFFVGGALGFKSCLYIQDDGGKFILKENEFIDDIKHEDVGAVFFDADNDGDMDLYVVSGGTEKSPNDNYYTDRFYENNGTGDFKKLPFAIPNITNSGLCVISTDFDNDGDDDLFVGGRVLPGHYGRSTNSYLLENISTKGKVKFIDVTKDRFPDMLNHIMLTSAISIDINNDGYEDMIVANEWGPIELFINNHGFFENRTQKYELNKHIGWWNSLATIDIDKDGDLDIVAGNLGLNHKYKSDFKNPFYLYIDDFDSNDEDDIVLAFHQNNDIFPVRGRQCSSEQMPFIKVKFENYNEYGKANLNDIYGEKLKDATSYKATCFATSLLINEGNYYSFKSMPNEVQISSVNKILTADLNNDDNIDILLLGNFHEFEVETPRNDGSYGHILTTTNKGKFSVVPNHISHLWANGNIQDASFIKVGNDRALILAKNNDTLTLLKIENEIQ